MSRWLRVAPRFPGNFLFMTSIGLEPSLAVSVQVPTATQTGDVDLRGTHYPAGSPWPCELQGDLPAQRDQRAPESECPEQAVPGRTSLPAHTSTAIPPVTCQAPLVLSAQASHPAAQAVPCSRLTLLEPLRPLPHL